MCELGQMSDLKQLQDRLRDILLKCWVQMAGEAGKERIIDGFDWRVLQADG